MYILHENCLSNDIWLFSALLLIIHMFCQICNYVFILNYLAPWMIHKENFTLEEITSENGTLDASRTTCWDNALNHPSSCIPFYQNSKVRSWGHACLKTFLNFAIKVCSVLTKWFFFADKISVYVWRRWQDCTTRSNSRHYKISDFKMQSSFQLWDNVTTWNWTLDRKS